MKKIKIAHLYYDLMNLYGENGNIRYLTNELEKQNIKTEIHFLSLEDNINFNDYDIFYIGMGNEDNKIIVLENILQYKEDIKKAIENKKYFLITGNALDLFGENITTQNEETKEALGIFNYKVKEEDFRIVGEQFYETTGNNKENKILGFQNRYSILESNNIEPLFQVKKGTGHKPNSKIEGIKYNNFYGTYLLGPILVRNPYFTDNIVKSICDDLKITYNKKHDGMAYKAYHEYIKNFHGEQ